MTPSETPQPSKHPEPPLPPAKEKELPAPLPEPEGDTHLQILRAGNSASKQIALTFDDGPHPTLTPKVLEILRERNVKATFFVLGNCVRLYPWVLRQTMAEGHEIGNHTYSHRWLNGMSNELINREITETQNEIKSITGSEPRLFRPPYGAFRSDTKAIFREHNLSIILWNVDTLDWKVRNEAKILNTVTNQTRGGSIILCHDIHTSTIKALPEMLDTLIANGYEFTTVSQLCGLPGIRLATTPTNQPTQTENP